MDRAVAARGASARVAVGVAAAGPLWDGVVGLSASGVLGERVVAHAGPPFRSIADVPAPVRHSIAAACLFEGWASSWDQAWELIADESVRLADAQGLGIMVPLCGVASPSMAAVRVRDPESGACRFSVLNEGQVHATRFGTRDDLLIDHLRWLHGPFAAELTTALEEPVELMPLLGRSLDLKDDGHGQTVAGTRLLVERLNRDRLSAQSIEFLAASPAFALNPWMAAVSCALAGAEGQACGLIVRAGGNGFEFGVQVARAPGVWITCASPVPVPVAGQPTVEGALPAVGDSALLDLFGLGAQVHVPQGTLAAECLALGGRRIGLDAVDVCFSAEEPPVALGIIDGAGIRGRLAAGLIRVPVALMASAAK